MLRMLVWASLFFLVVLSVGVKLASSSGATQPAPTAFQGFEGCVFPCWYGMPLTEIYTNGEEFVGTLARAGYQTQRVEQDEYHITHFLTAAEQCDLELTFELREQASTLYFTNGPDVNMGDWLTVAGEPLLVSTTGMLAYTEGVQNVWVYLHGDWFTWRSSIWEIQMTTRAVSGMDAFAWYGVTPRWYYCQLTPEFRVYVC